MIRDVTYVGVVSAQAQTAVSGESVGTGNGTSTTFTHTTAHLPVMPFSVTVTAGSVTATDDGQGNLTGTGVSSGTVNYLTGAISITFSSAPSSGTAVTVSYSYGTSFADGASGGAGASFNEVQRSVVPANLMFSQKVVPSNVINQAAGLPYETAKIGVVVSGSQDNVNFTPLGALGLNPGGSKAIELGAQAWSYINIYAYSPTLPAVAHLTVEWANYTI